MNFKIVTVGFTQEDEGILNPAPKTLDRDVILENHRDLVSWGKNTVSFNRSLYIEITSHFYQFQVMEFRGLNDLGHT